MYIFVIFVLQVLALQTNGASVPVAKKCPNYSDNLEKTVEKAEKYYQSLLLAGVSEEKMEREIDRTVVCIYKHFGLIKPDNSADVTAVVNFYTLISPYFREQLPASEKKLESLSRCLSKKSNSAEEAKNWILVCVQEDFRLHPIDYAPYEEEEKKLEG